MIDRLNVAVLAVLLTSCGAVGGGRDDSTWQWRGSCGVPIEEGPLWRAYHTYHVTVAPPELAHVHNAEVTYDGMNDDSVTIAYWVDDTRYAVTYLVENAP